MKINFSKSTVTMVAALLICCFVCTGCLRTELALLHDRDQIESIYLVDYNMLDTANLSVLPEGSVQIENVDAFLTDLHALPFVRFMPGDPTFKDTLGVYILYANGDVEVIDYMTQFYLSEGTVTYRRMQCNFTDFDHLVQSYYQSSGK